VGKILDKKKKVVLVLILFGILVVVSGLFGVYLYDCHVGTLLCVTREGDDGGYCVEDKVSGCTDCWVGRRRR
jgi:hypothetical protein